MTELDYDKLCQDPAYRANVDAANAAGLEIQYWCRSIARGGHWSGRHESRIGKELLWGEGERYRIAPGQQWPIPTERPERKAREWWVRINHGNGRIVNSGGFDDRALVDRGATPKPFDAAIRVREVLPGDDVERLRAEVAELKRQIAEANAACETAVTAMVKAGEERDAALIELGRKQIAKKVTAQAADGVIPECGPLPQSVFQGAPEWVNWAHVACPLGAVIWTELQCTPKISGWRHPDGGRATNSGGAIQGVSWQLSQTRRHRA